MRELVAAFSILGFSVSPFFQMPSWGQDGLVVAKWQVLAQESLDLTSRDDDPWVNEVMADNILLTLHYLKGDGNCYSGSDCNSDSLRKPFSVSFILEPGQVFAFHQDVLPEFEGKVAKTTEATFHSDQGFKSDGYLFGDGVCHLASLVNWVASRAGLKVVAAVNHNFRPIPGIPEEFGTAIYYLEDGVFGNKLQNLYIENILDFPVLFVFKVDQQHMKLIAAKKTG